MPRRTVPVACSQAGGRYATSVAVTASQLLRRHSVEPGAGAGAATMARRIASASAALPGQEPGTMTASARRTA
ncbi:hypothetical protein [Paenibacillus thiaminolyticus]|uniref:hypothetical protein n=1 Tax=Paenibacillus thiaminolyticus TaxID=49283 RepID=UPI0021758160|nr:hypothetical protein [Paenibacillus thiaminolyticus]